MQIQIRESEANTNITKKVIGTQVSQDLYNQLKAEADDSFMSISDLLRKIIFNYYQKKGND